MKKIIGVLIVLLMIVLPGCNKSQPPAVVDTPTNTDATAPITSTAVDTAPNSTSEHANYSSRQKITVEEAIAALDKLYPEFSKEYKNDGLDESGGYSFIVADQQAEISGEYRSYMINPYNGNSYDEISGEYLDNVLKSEVETLMTEEQTIAALKTKDLLKIAANTEYYFGGYLMGDTIFKVKIDTTAETGEQPQLLVESISGDVYNYDTNEWVGNIKQ